MKAAAHRRLQLWLIALDLALAAGLLALHVWAGRPDLPPLPDPPVLPIRAMATAEVQHPDVPETLRHAYATAPIFTSDRKPDAPASATSGPLATGAPELTGVALAPGLAYALIAVGGAPAKAVGIGQLVPGTRWTVQRIAAHAAVLHADDGTTLRLLLWTASRLATSRASSATVPVTSATHPTPAQQPRPGSGAHPLSKSTRYPPRALVPSPARSARSAGPTV